MKKILALILALTLAISFTACGGSKAPASSAAPA
ncbi:MAG: amino acid ABC transporter substrate-binding protein, partial [Hydrogenoanaerobacterium sp.]